MRYDQSMSLCIYPRPLPSELESAQIELNRYKSSSISYRPTISDLIRKKITINVAGTLVASMSFATLFHSIGYTPDWLYLILVFAICTSVMVSAIVTTLPDHLFGSGGAPSRRDQRVASDFRFAPEFVRNHSADTIACLIESERRSIQQKEKRIEIFKPFGLRVIVVQAIVMDAAHREAEIVSAIEHALAHKGES